MEKLPCFRGKPRVANYTQTKYDSVTHFLVETNRVQSGYLWIGEYDIKPYKSSQAYVRERRSQQSTLAE